MRTRKKSRRSSENPSPTSRPRDRARRPTTTREPGVRRAPVLLPVRGFELSPRSRFGDDLLVEPSHGVDSERGEIEIDRLYPELAHGAQVVDDLGVAAGEQEPLAVVGLRGRRGSVAMDPKASATLAGSRPAASLRRRSTAARLRVTAADGQRTSSVTSGGQLALYRQKFVHSPTSRSHC